MGDQLDNRPVFTIVMGCNGAGKSAWKVENRDRLPERYFDKDSIANGVGGWDTPSARERTDEYVDAEIDKALAGRYNFGMESTYSGRPGPELVERAIEAGYRIEGIYIGTANPEINIERIRTRVENNTGHHVDPERVPDRYRHSLHNLRRTADRFDELTIVDNTEERERGIPDPRTELVLEKGRTAWETRDPASWVTTWKARFEQAMDSRRRQGAKDARGEALKSRRAGGTQVKQPAEAPPRASEAAAAAADQSRKKNGDDTPPR